MLVFWCAHFFPKKDAMPISKLQLTIFLTYLTNVWLTSTRTIGQLVMIFRLARVIVRVPASLGNGAVFRMRVVFANVIVTVVEDISLRTTTIMGRKDKVCLSIHTKEGAQTSHWVQDSAMLDRLNFLKRGWDFLLAYRCSQYASHNRDCCLRGTMSMFLSSGRYGVYQ